MSFPCQAFPKVVPVGREAELAVRSGPPGPALAPGGAYSLRFFSKVNRTEDVRLDAACDAEGVLHCKLPFTTAGEYVLDICPPGNEEPVATALLFAVKPELAPLRPYKGDLHMHTPGSDGRDTPAAMVLRARETGMDFIAVTDHDNHAPSLQAAEETARLGLDLLTLPGEEVTIREIGGHVLSLNASAGVGSLRHAPAGDEERAAIVRDELAGRNLAAPLTAEQYAHAVWTVRKVRQFGGAALLAHPYWEGTSRKFYPPRCLVDQLVADGLCDGWELMGGSPTTEGNRLAVAGWMEQACRGRHLPVIGGSDAHGAEELGVAYWTIILAPELSRRGVIEAVLDLRSVACDRKTGLAAAMYGPFDVVEYAYFLHREFFPLHDDICRREAELCRQAQGNFAPDVRGALAGLRSELATLRERFWLAGR